MSDTLFDLTGEYLQALDVLTDPEIDEQVVSDTLEGLLGAIEVKSEGYIAVLNRLDMELTACRKHEQEWKARKQIRENAIKRLKKALTDTMVAIDKTEIAAGDVKIKLVNNGGLLPLIVDEDAEIPDRFKKIIYETDNSLIRKALDNGEDLPFARYGERGKGIRIK